MIKPGATQIASATETAEELRELRERVKAVLIATATIWLQQLGTEDRREILRELGKTTSRGVGRKGER